MGRPAAHSALRGRTRDRLGHDGKWRNLAKHPPSRLIPPDEIALVLDNIGLPNSGINLAFGSTGTISDSDGEILIALKPGNGSAVFAAAPLEETTGSAPP